MLPSLFSLMSRLCFLPLRRYCSQVQCNRIEYVEESAFANLNSLLGLYFVAIASFVVRSHVSLCVLVSLFIPCVLVFCLATAIQSGCKTGLESERTSRRTDSPASSSAPRRRLIKVNLTFWI